MEKIQRFYRLGRRDGCQAYAYEDEQGRRLIEGDIFGEWRLSQDYADPEEWRILAPCQPSKIICLGLNYRDHAQEMGALLPERPVIFSKTPNTIIGPGEKIRYPSHWVKRLDYEAELAVVMGKICRQIKPQEAEEYIFGYTCANDITARDLQPPDGQWTLAKSFDTFCPLGPALVQGLDAANLEIRAYLNGILRQHSNTKNLIFSVNEAVAYISRFMTLLPGDVILTGTPAGVGSMVDGDEIAIEIEHIGRLVNIVKSGA